MTSQIVMEEKFYKKTDLIGLIQQNRILEVISIDNKGFIT